MNAKSIVIIAALALAAAPHALAQGPPEEFPGPGDFPADPSEHFPDQGCEHTPDRPENVPGWVVIPFQDCGDEENGEASAGWQPILP